MYVLTKILSDIFTELFAYIICQKQVLTPWPFFTGKYRVQQKVYFILVELKGQLNNAKHLYVITLYTFYYSNL